MRLDHEALFRGRYKRSLDEGSRVTIPRELRQTMRKRGAGESPLLVLYPSAIGCVSFVPVTAATGKPNIWRRELRWDETIDRILQQIQVRPCKPWFRRDVLSKPVLRATQTLLDEGTIHENAIRQLSGREFEQLVEEILLSEGVHVQSRVRLLCAEIDLLLATYNGQLGPEFVILECKHKTLSGNIVGISEVLRLHGLADAIAKAGACQAGDTSHLFVFDPHLGSSASLREKWGCVSGLAGLAHGGFYADPYKTP